MLLFLKCHFCVINLIFGQFSNDISLILHIRGNMSILAQIYHVSPKIYFDKMCSLHLKLFLGRELFINLLIKISEKSFFSSNSIF